MPEWGYTYRSPDGVRHEARIRATGRDAAFALLRGQGIRPMKLYPAPGILNRLRIDGWRWAMAAMLVAAGLAVAALIGRNVSDRHRPTAWDVLPRHQLEGLPSDWCQRLGDYLPPADAYLALFAQPGRMDIRETGSSGSPLTEEALLREVPSPSADDPPWVVALKRVLVGMKEEAVALVKLGKDPTEIAIWLEERQKMEAEYRRQILEGTDSGEEKLRRLRAMGL